MRAVCHFSGPRLAEENLVLQVATRASLFMIGCVKQAVFAVSRGHVVLPVDAMIRYRQVPVARLRPHHQPT